MTRLLTMILAVSSRRFARPMHKPDFQVSTIRP